MDHKRKANGSAPALDDRAAKRQKGPADFDLLKGETPESTTHYGLQFLAQIERTKDKNGRNIAGYFKQLLPREGNEEYYARTRMPISLETIEQKLEENAFSNLSELESYVKRMVSNAKDYYPKNSETFEDAERVRKALSNYMVKTNPAYKLLSNYSAQPTPLPGDETATPTRTPGRHISVRVSKKAAPVEPDDDAEGDDADDRDAEGEDDDQGNDEDATPARGSRRRKAGRGRRSSPGPDTPQAQDRSASAMRDADAVYENVSYKGLSFQEAQEKIVEELLRQMDEEEDGYPHFEPFHNLPPRSLKDYYSLITQPLSLKKLQKLVRGIHGRGDVTGVSDFKNWAAFEEKASLLWENAYKYNEDGSEISDLAKDLEATFKRHVKEAKAVVSEPSQPKIKIKVAPGQEAPAPAKKITITVANKNSPAESPAPGAGSSEAVNSQAARGAASAAAGSPSQPDKAASGPASGPASTTGSQNQSTTQVNGTTPSQSPAVTGAIHTAQSFTVAPLTNGHTPAAAAPPPPPPPAPVVTIWDKKQRAPGKGLKDALITNVTIRTHPSMAPERRFRFQIPPRPTEAQQLVTLQIPVKQYRQQIIVSLSQDVLDNYRAYKLFVIANSQILPTAVPMHNDPIAPGAKVFDTNLGVGTNNIQIHMIAALPKGQKLPNGAEAELEIVNVIANLSRS